MNLKNKKKMLSVQLNIEEFEALQKIADDDSRSLSSLVRLIVKKLINKEITVVTKVKNE